MTTRIKGTEERILAAAHTVFLKRGMAGARTQEIADEAGVNKALLHYYFRSKEKLALAVFRRAVEQLLPRIYVILESDLSIEGKVRSIVRIESDYLGKHPYLPGYVASEIHYNPGLVLEVFNERGPPPLRKLRAQLDEQVRANAIAPITAEEFVTNLLSLLFFPFMARPALPFMLNLDEGEFEAFLNHRKASLADFFLRGLRP